MKLSTKASLIIITVVVGLFIPLSSIVLRFQEVALRKATFNAVDGVVKSWARSVTAFVANAHQDVNTLAATLSVEDLQARRLDAIASQLRKVYQNQNFGNGIFLLDPQGNILLDYPSHPDLQGRSVAFREYFIRTMAEKKGVLSAPYVSARTGRPVLTVTAPLRDQQGIIQGVVACSYDLLDPGALGGLRQQRLGRSGYLYLFDRSRMMILHPDTTRILQRDIPLGANRILDRAIEGFEGPGATVNSRGIPMLVSYMGISGTPWILGAQIPQAEAFESTTDSRRLMLLTTAISLLIVLVVGVLTVRHFSKPIARLHEAARAITRELEEGSTGREVLPFLDSIQTKDEIGTLAQTFRELVERQHESLGLLKQAATEWELTFDSVLAAILCLDGEGRILRINRTASDWFRLSPEAALGQEARTLVLGADDSTSFWPVASQLDAEHSRTWTSSLPHQEGTFEIRASPVLQDGVASGMILVFRDVTEQVRKADDIRKQAFFDALTGLPNRTLLMDRLQQALAAGARSGRAVGVLFLDLDHFKEVNDTWGHDAGDQLLKEAGARLKSLIRKNDTAARLGGDEFVMVISEVNDSRDVELIAAKVLETIRGVFRLEGQDLQVGTSIGIALAPRDGDDGPTLLKNADAAMYQAKRAGRSTYRLFSDLPLGRT